MTRHRVPGAARLLGSSAIAVLAVVATLAAPLSPVGAVFTADAAARAGSVGTETIAPLAGGTAGRTSDGVATVSWSTPARADAAGYAITRTVGAAAPEPVPAHPATAGETTFFSDDLSVGLGGETFLASLTGNEHHACGLTTAGTAYCWGAGQYGRLGIGSRDNRLTPTPVDVANVPGGAFSQLAAGRDHTCGLTTMGAVYCWGTGLHGELGAGPGVSDASSPVPVAMNGVRGAVVSLVSGHWHTCALTDEGEVYCWGLGGSGQRGDGSLEVSNHPVRVDTSALGAPAFVAISAGQRFTCGIVVDGSILCWGDNRYGQLGSGSQTQTQTTPARVDTSAIGGVGFTAVTAGFSHTCALASTGEAYCWGRGDSGELGDGRARDRDTPTATVDTSALGSLAFDRVDAGNSYTCGVLRGGSGVCWGNDVSGQLGNGARTGNQSRPTLVDTSQIGTSGTGTFVDIVASTYHACALTFGGATYCWAMNADGQLGIGTTNSTTRPALPTRAETSGPRSCAPGWTQLGADRCAPGPDIDVSYRIAHTIAGWRPATPLEVDVPMLQR